MKAQCAYSVTATNPTGSIDHMAVFTTGGPNATGGTCTAPQRDATTYHAALLTDPAWHGWTVTLTELTLPTDMRGPRRAVQYVNEVLMGVHA